MTSAQILIARHGNTFHHHEPPRRVGARTDIPLVETTKARNIGRYLQAVFKPDLVISSPLARTRHTAAIALEIAGVQSEITIDPRFTEIDHGPDENQLEEAVIQRIGQEALDLWNNQAKIPDGWDADPDQLTKYWQELADCVWEQRSKTLVVTSNGVARFAPQICGDPSLALQLKMSTGHISMLEKKSADAAWECVFWNREPLGMLLQSA